MSERHDLLGDVVSKAQAVKVRNVMNPLLWLNAVTVPSCIIGAMILRDQLFLAVPLILVGLAVPIKTMMSYDFFAKSDPQRLQSEEFVIAQQRMLLQSKGSSQLIDVTLVPIGSNPEILALSDEAGHE